MNYSQEGNGNKRIVRNTVFLYFRLFFVLAVTLYTSRVVLNVLGASDYGLYNVVCGFVAMFAFINTSMANATQRFYSYEIGKNEGRSISKVYSSALVTQVSLMLVVIFVVEIFGVWYLHNKMVIPPARFAIAEKILQFSIISFAIVFIQIPYSSLIMAKERMDYYAVVSIVDALFKLLIVILMQHVSCDRLFYYGLLMMISSLLSFLFYYLYVKVQFPTIKFTSGIDRNLSKKMVVFSGWNILGSMAYVFKGQGLNLLLNSFFGTIVNAARGISYQVLGAIQGFTNNIFMVFRPQMVQSYAVGNYSRTRKMMFSMSKVTCFLFYLIALPILLEVEQILNIWLGVVPRYTSEFTILIILNMMVSNFNTPLSQVVHATGRMKKYQIVTSLLIISILPFSWILLKLGSSPISVYWCSLVLTILNQCVCLFVVRGIFPYSIKGYLKDVIFPCFVVVFLSAIIPFAIVYTMKPTIYRILLVSLSSWGAILFFSYQFGLDKIEKKMAISYIQKILFRIKK